jgi:DNA polymerase III epsilon subunit-like protein
MQYLLLGIQTNTLSTSNLVVDNAADPAALQESSHENLEVGVNNDTVLQTPRTLRNTSDFDIDNVVYIVFDIETTGFSRIRHSIIEIACILLDPFGVKLPDSSFSSLIKPPKPIPPHITDITGITNELVRQEKPFDIVAKDFLRFLKEKIIAYEDDNGIGEVKSYVFVAHNGKVFDVPFLFKQLGIVNLIPSLSFLRKCYLLDTLQVVRGCVNQKLLTIVPENKKLATLYNYVSGNSLDDKAHRAAADTEATHLVLIYAAFWNERQKYIIPLDEEGMPITPAKPRSQKTKQVINPNDDSDTDDDDETGDNRSEAVEEDNDCDNEEEEQSGWSKDVTFEGVDTDSLFDNAFRRRSTRNIGDDADLRTGVQCSENSINSPLKSWRAIFTTSILERIVQYTNEYGSAKDENWTNITRTDLTDFISVLFVSSIQKRKDRTTQWFSNDVLYENGVIKRIMSGRKFHTILRFLHVCSLEEQPDPEDDDYDPGYKVKELKDMLEDRFGKLFVPGRNLSLDETLLRAFGRIKFKVRIVTKSARYGIKLYVVTDAETAFVLKIIIYTGKSTYNESDSENKKKTVQVVRQLCQDYKDTYRCVFVDRFYTSIDLLKELDKLGLYVTGTCMRNRLSKEVVIKKQSREYKEMQRGDYKKHVYTYKNDNGEEVKYGLVCWKDRDIVYCLTNSIATDKLGVAYRRVTGGRVCIQRPMVIEHYNKYMGGVDLADQRRLHCNSTIMGGHRWWLKLFFYLLDVGTSNALILYNHAMGGKVINLVEFKHKLIMSLVGDKLAMVPTTANVVHEVTRTNQRHACAYCSLMGKYRRTRFKCAAPGCQVPICSVGSGIADSDCFALSHRNEDIRKMTVEKFQCMLLKTNKDKK